MKKDVFDELVVVKRSGQRVSFNSYKIAVAIKQAFDVVYEVYDEKNINKIYEVVLKTIETSYAARKTINVEDIQDIIENELKNTEFGDVYTAFHDYREKRAASRKAFTTKAQHKFIKAMEHIASAQFLKNDDALTPNEVLLKYGRTVASEFAKSYIVDNKFLRAHEEGSIFIKALEDFPLGLVTDAHLDFSNELALNNSLNSLTAEILSAQDEINGELNIPALDYLLAPWLIRQYRYYYQENIINYAKVMGFEPYLNLKKIQDLITHEHTIADKEAVFKQAAPGEVATRIFKFAYDTMLDKITNILTSKLEKLFANLAQKSPRKISVSFGTNQTTAGILINQTIIAILTKAEVTGNLIFIFKVKKDTPASELEKLGALIIKDCPLCLAFIDNSFNKAPNEIEYFASGTRIFENANDSIRISSGRLLLGETAINMSRLGLKYAGKPIKSFYQALDELVELVKNQLLLVFETIGNKNKDNYKSLFKNNVLDDEKLETSGKIRKVIKNGNLNIGVVGLKECVIALTSNTKDQYELVVDILNELNKKCAKITRETKLNFYISEPISKRARRELMALDKAIYGEIINVTDGPYYGLVSELPVIKETPERLANIQKLFTGGNMLSLKISKNISTKRLGETIEELKTAGIGFVKFSKTGEVAQNEY